MVTDRPFLPSGIQPLQQQLVPQQYPTPWLGQSVDKRLPIHHHSHAFGVGTIDELAQVV
jgi:hypothetical protein